VEIQTLLGRLVIVGIDQQHSISSHLLGMPGEPDSLAGGIGAGACNDRNPPLANLTVRAMVRSCSS
jgi:hypothetical protein